jgi:hypothetical protein
VENRLGTCFTPDCNAVGVDVSSSNQTMTVLFDTKELTNLVSYSIRRQNTGKFNPELILKNFIGIQHAPRSEQPLLDYINHAINTQEGNNHCPL